MATNSNLRFNPNDLTQQPELPGLANRIVDSLEHGGLATEIAEERQKLAQKQESLTDAFVQLAEDEANRCEASDGGQKKKKPRKELSKKAQLARQLNWKKSQLLNSYVNMRGCTPEKLRTQLEYCFKACLRTLQKVADEAGIKGDYTTFLPEEKTREFARRAKQAGMTPAQLKTEMEKI